MNNITIDDEYVDKLLKMEMEFKDVPKILKKRVANLLLFAIQEKCVQFGNNNLYAELSLLADVYATRDIKRYNW